jgi:hypothetical protein
MTAAAIILNKTAAVCDSFKTDQYDPKSLAKKTVKGMDRFYFASVHEDAFSSRELFLAQLRPFAFRLIVNLLQPHLCKTRSNGFTHHHGQLLWRKANQPHHQPCLPILPVRRNNLSPSILSIFGLTPKTIVTAGFQFGVYGRCQIFAETETTPHHCSRLAEQNPQFFDPSLDPFIKIRRY